MAPFTALAFSALNPLTCPPKTGGRAITAVSMPGTPESMPKIAVPSGEYRVLRMNEMREVKVHIVRSRAKPGGIGEPGVPPVASAACNAVFALTGKRIRRLPIRTEELRK